MTSLPKQFGRYTLSDRLASGGMATLYLGRLVGTDGFVKIVAVKVIHEHLIDDEKFVNMFINEARLASRIAHPNVVQTIELGRVGETQYMAMEFVNGESVGSLLRRARPTPGYCARIIADAAAGLHAAHSLRSADGKSLQVVHRDVSPENILISYDGTVKVADFGVARALDNLQTTRGGEVKGKYAYMAPEQLNPDADVDQRADVFALGIVLFEMTTASRLFKGDSGAASVANVMAGTIPLPSQRRPGYPLALEQIVLRALARDPDQRFQSAQALQEALERFIMQSGAPVMQSHVGQLMAETFADRIDQKRALVHKCEKGQSLDTVEIDIMGSAYDELVTSGVEHPPERRHNVPLLIGLAAGALAAAALVVFLLARNGASVDPPPHPGAVGATAAVDARPRERITIAIHATPSTATIFFAGKPVSNPFELRLASGQGEEEAMISAPGYMSKNLKISLAAGGRFLIGLQRKAPIAPPPAVRADATPKKRGRVRRRRRPPRRKERKKALGDRDVTANPYGK